MNQDQTTEPPLSPDAIAALVGNHQAFLGFLERRVGSKAEAEDILQEAFVKGVERAASLRDSESVVAWFYRMLRNAVIDHHRRRGAAGRAMDAFAHELDLAEQPTAEVKDAVCQCVKTLSETLKPEYAEALRQVEVEGMSVQGYAAAIGIQPNNAAVRVHRAREALRKRVMASCGTCAEHGCVECSCQPAAGKPASD